MNLELPKDLPGWTERSLSRGEHILATSNQGTVLHYAQGGHDFVVKTAMGRGAILRARRATLQREARAYQRLDGVQGVPRFVGFPDQRYLVLEFVRGMPYREADIADREAWFDELLSIIRECHRRGVAHGDLKSKSNLMVRDDGRPCMIDFGTTVIRKDGFAPINNRVFAYVRQLDLNAWVKHKYRGRYEDATARDRALLKYSLVESLLRKYRNWRMS
ncbi:MAG: hypothetical protein R3348_06120 [Xanthomonadales bacterium]|nr:hypothetical protein [Xanthomonadales bacterium]